MNCGFNQVQLSMYADGALARADVVRVENHLAECEECRNEVEDHRMIGNALHSLPRERAPHGLIERIVAKAEARENQSAWNVAMWTVGAVWTTATDGFTIAEEREKLLRKESPVWVARWVLFV